MYSLHHVLDLRHFFSTEEVNMNSLKLLLEEDQILVDKSHAHGTATEPHLSSFVAPSLDDSHHSLVFSTRQPLSIHHFTSLRPAFQSPQAGCPSSLPAIPATTSHRPPSSTIGFRRLESWTHHLRPTAMVRVARLCPPDAVRPWRRRPGRPPPPSPPSSSSVAALPRGPW